MKSASLKIKKVARCFITKIRYKKMKTSSIMISKRYRIWLAKKYVNVLRRISNCEKLQAWYRMKKVQNNYKIIRKAAWVFTSWYKTIILRRKYLIKIKQKRENENLSLQLEQLKQRLKEEEENRINLENITRENMIAELKEAAEKELEQLRNQLKANAEEKLKPSIAPEPSLPPPVTVSIRTPEKEDNNHNNHNQSTYIDATPLITPKVHRNKSFMVDDVNLIEQLQREVQDLRKANEVLIEENVILKEKNVKLSSFADVKMGEVASVKVAMTKAEKDHELKKTEYNKMVALISKLKKEKQILMQDFLVKLKYKVIFNVDMKLKDMFECFNIKLLLIS